MSYSNDILENAARRIHDATFNTTIDVYIPTESDAGADGIDRSYPDTPTQSAVTAQYADPEESTERDEGGTTADLDAVFYVRDDARSSWDDFGVSGEGVARVEDTETNLTYAVQTVTDAKDGRVRLGCVEV